MTTKTLRVLVGDDQIGVADSLQQKAFLRNYEGPTDFDFRDKPEQFIEQAKVGNYDALLIDLNWNVDGNREDTTGLKVLLETKEYAPIRLLHTSNDLSLDLRCAAQLCGATGSIPKYRGREYMRKALLGEEGKLK
jgi:DNA-binding NarL/FixJ family response regulator